MSSEHSKDRELETLWDKLEKLKRSESSLPPSKAAVPSPSSAKLKAEIEERIGFFPPVFAPALEFPALLETLWRQQVSSYHDNPLPELFKEKLLFRLSRFTKSSYSIVTHACMLYRLGITARELKQTAEKPTLDSNAVGQAFAGMARPIKDWPDDDPAFEEGIIACCSAIFLGTAESRRCAAEVKDIVGSSCYAHLIALLVSAKASHVWLEAHPEIGYEEHPLVRENYIDMVRDEPQLVQIFRNPKELAEKSFARSDASDGSSEGEDLYRELFENASDIIYTHDFVGHIRSVNRAIERVAGYTRAEALKMKITDIIAPEYSHLARKLIDPQISGEIPLNFELEIFSKQRNRIVLGVSTRPIFRGGKPVAVQGIARDITTRKRTETELQEANEKLEAWVSELEQRTREMTMLNEMGDILRACLTTEEAYNVIVRTAQQIFPAKVGALYVIAASRNTVEAVAVWGDTELAERAFSPSECWALRRGRTHWVEDPVSGLICMHIHHDCPDGYVCIPMMAQSEAIGVLHLMQPENGKMTESKQRMAVTMSEHIGMALSNLRLHETLRSQSIRDPLTGLFNRRFMEESLELEIRRASRNQRPLGMIMIDLDHFKYFNDNFGHEAGDLLLKELGALLKGNIRAEDIACRYGGEEFTLILPEGTGDVTLQRAEFYKDAIQQLDVHYRGRSLGRITASMGVAIFPEHGRTSKALLEAADKALYRSKRAGRDRVTMAGN